MLATGRAIGQATSVAVAGAVFTALGGASAGASLVGMRGSLTAAETSTLQGDFVHGFQMALLVCAAFAAIGVLTAFVRGSNQQSTAPRAR